MNNQEEKIKVKINNKTENATAEELEKLCNDRNLIKNIEYNEKNIKNCIDNNKNRNYKENDDNNDDNKKKDDDDSDDINEILKNMPLSDDTTCGYWIFKGKFLQKFANKKAYVTLYGLVGCIFGMTYAYFNGTITTLEKRFKIPSRNTGIISVGNDISQLFVSAVLSYYAGKGHRPRWLGIGLITIVVFCLLTALPQLIYGPGEDALSLTKEYGANADENSTMEIIEKHRKKELCRLKSEGRGVECESGEGNFTPQIILFVAQFISGVGGSLYFSLGVTYMDDNVKKSKTPALISLSYFLRMLGPAMGYALASFCLRLYISPDLTPVIKDNDPRWLGAWWMGWLIMSVLLIIFGFLISMFPRTLPRAAARKMLELEKGKAQKEEITELPASFKDMKDTFKRLIMNATLMCNNFASIFYIFGYTPYWIFTPKYIEIQYRQSAATSSLVTGTIALAFSALGILISGFVLTKYKPSARYMAAWNVVCGIISVLGISAYIYLGCPGNESSMIVNIPESNSTIQTCNSACQCDYVRYSPVCGEDGNIYISPCHAGCKQYDTNIEPNGKKIYYDCSCITSSIWNTSKEFIQQNPQFIDALKDPIQKETLKLNNGGKAISGACPVDCFKQFVLFLTVMCFLKFVGATGRATNFLVSVRCVPEKDKAAAMGFDIMLMSLFAFIPSPIFFGWVLDKLCLVWGKTCTNKGNCWLYDAESLRYNLNIIASIFVAIGTLFDIGVWYFVKDVKIFDEEIKETELKEIHKEEETKLEKKTEI